MFQHFVLTRFNLRKKDWLETKSKTQVLTDEWMRNRLELFENYCFASVKAQTEQNFNWLVFFDVSTTPEFREIIDRLASELRAFIPIYADGMEEFLPAIQRELNARLTQPYLITSRLDNDDCLHQDYIKEVQAQFDQQSFLAIDFIDGFTLQVAPKVRFAKHAHVHNPFLSLIETSKEYKTIWCNERHGYWSEIKQVKIVRKKPMWMSVIHIENKINAFKGFGDVNLEQLQAFNICPRAWDYIETNIEPYRAWHTQGLYHQLRTGWKVNAKILRRKLFHGS
ncbi:hypothetical protein EXT48_00945 [Pseudoalteromonas sp. CO348]|uniref:glycosyltransferase n=1 Tax=Pseudoalteromonas TaxID=53246 RepID=UPI001022E9F4|nr:MULTISPECIES: glycosyltransferase [Pseudoalteromonas]MCG9767071.1 putative rhamnosyl transferase [Pseudoalteromonas piscicida]RZG09628.1 hypothetical protein EXT48_00945 [Pseudoalteromonas sp. CO348]